MPEHDPLAAEFAALRTAVLVRPPGVRAAQIRVRQRRHRTLVVLTSVVAFVVAAAGVALAGIRPPHREATTTLPSGTPSSILGTSGGRGPVVPGPSVTQNGGRHGTVPPTSTSTAGNSDGSSCHQYGAVLLDHPTTSTVTVKVDQQGQYPLCPGERVRVFVAVYTDEPNQTQQLYYSKVAYLDAAHNPLTLPYQVPQCRDMVFVISGNQTIKQTLPAGTDPYTTGPDVYGSPQWGPYNGIIWLVEQDRCPTPTGTG